MKNYVNKIAKTCKQNRFEGIITILDEIGVDYDIEKINHCDAIGNIIVKFNEGSNKKIVICAHYDNVNYTPGANDNASGCSILLKLINEFKGTNKHLEFVFFDLEEYGLIGSRHYLINNDDDIELVINLDMCGLGENIVYTIDNMINNQFEDIFNKHNCIRIERLPHGDNDTFIRNGVQTIDIINSTTKDVEWFKKYSENIMPPFFPEFLETMHNDNDTIDTLNFDQMNKILLLLTDLIKNVK